MLRDGDHRCRPLLFDGSPLLPSTVYAPPRGPLVVGRDAALLARADPARFEPCPKRRVGDVTVLLGDREVPVLDLIAAVLARVADEARRVAGRLPPAVLTHPALWGRTRRDVLAAAAAAAGLSVAGMVAEPTAAATYFTAVLGGELRTGQALAVFDFGGGTTDVTVVRRAGSGFDVAATGGLDDLGGVDLDAVIVEQVGARLTGPAAESWQRLARPSGPDDLRRRTLLWQDARHAREMLSRTAAAPLHVPGDAAGTHLTRAEFERWATPLIARAVAETSRTVGRAGLASGQLAGVFLVGGTSRTPLVSRLLHQTFDMAPTVLEQPETAVAEGAARSAAGHGPSPHLVAALGHLSPAVDAPESPPHEPPARGRYGWAVGATLLVVAAVVALALLRPWQTGNRGPAADGRTGSPSPSPSAAAACPSVSEANDALARSGNLASGVAPALAEDPTCRNGYALVTYAVQATGGVDQGGRAILKRDGRRWTVIAGSTDLCGASGPHYDERPDWAKGLPDDVLELAGCHPTDYVD
ncbi:MAG TPA: Hsp70 family protein [Actinocatenispora sp.]